MASFSGSNPTDSSNTVCVFTSSGSFTPSFTGTVEVLVVAGGGGGGMDMGGGGGGGGVIHNTAYSVTSGVPITVTVGSGGNGAPAGSTNGQPGGHQFTISATQGGNSVFGALTAIGGGFGASSYYGYLPNSGIGGTGGSGGGCSAYTHGGERYVDNNNTPGQGFPGGNSGNPTTGADDHYSGGGGGAGARGTSGPGHAGPNGARADGGIGILNTIMGVPYYWAGGGGGSCYTHTQGGNGGLGGGGGGAAGGNGNTVGVGNSSGINPSGNGGLGNNQPGGNGGANTGGGGGGGSHYNANNKGGDGGSGIVIVRFSESLGSAAVINANIINTNSIVLNLDAANIKSVPVFSAEVLVVAGGGAGGGRHAGGGGGAGVIYNPLYSLNLGVAYTVTVGAGGSGFALNSGYGGRGNNGGNSVFDTLTALGGGGGGGYADGLATATGATGGSGGGGAYAEGLPGGNGSAGSGTSGQGFVGGVGSQPWNGGGGGGAGGAGSNASGQIGGGGGPGRLFSISGTPVYYAGGGGGCGEGGPGTTNGGAGGVGGGGNGNSTYNPTVATAGTANTGGGGGGSRDAPGAAGGSGIVVIRYAGPQRAIGGNITTVGSDTVHTFTTSGTFTPTGWTDLSDFRNNGTLVNGVGYNSASGGSLVFDGVDDYIEVPSLSNYNFSSAMSVFFWHKNIGGDYRGVIANTYGGAGFDLRYGREDFSGGANNGTILNVYINTSAGTFSRTINAELNEWGHYGFTYNGSSLIAYKNGTPFSTIAASGTVSVTSNPVRIGRNLVNTEPLSGNMSQASIYRRALAEAEVRQNFDATKMRFYGENSQVPATSGVDLKAVRPDLPSGFYWIKNSTMPNALRMYVDMTEEGGGYDFFPMQGNGTSIGSTNGVHSGIALGLDLVYPRSKQHWIAMSNFVRNVLGSTGNEYFTTVYSVYRETSAGAGSRGGNYTGDIMRNPAFYGTGTPDWRVPDGGRWWLRDTTFSEPNGDYTAYNFLGGYTHPNPYTGQDLQFNDATGQNYTTGGYYLLSTNSKP